MEEEGSLFSRETSKERLGGGGEVSGSDDGVGRQVTGLDMLQYGVVTQ